MKYFNFTSSYKSNYTDFQKEPYVIFLQQKMPNNIQLKMLYKTCLQIKQCLNLTVAIRSSQNIYDNVFLIFLAYSELETITIIVIKKNDYVAECECDNRKK